MKKRNPESAYRGGENRAGRIVLWALAGLCLLLSGVCLVLPGVKFSAVLFAGLATVWLCLLGLNAWAEGSRAGRFFRGLFVALLVLGAGAFCAAEGFILRASNGYQMSAKPDAVIVLGAGVNGRTPSLVLESRIEAAAAYLSAHPKIPVVLSGGQGSGEEISEARAMQEGLTALGIDPERLILEEASLDTVQNLNNSMALLEARGFDSCEGTVAVVTSDFHLFRVRLLTGLHWPMTVVGVPASTTWWWLNANYYVREVFALGKLALTRLTA